jgi:hypothetical protein
MATLYNLTPILYAKLEIRQYLDIPWWARRRPYHMSDEYGEVFFWG